MTMREIVVRRILTMKWSSGRVMTPPVVLAIPWSGSSTMFPIMGPPSMMTSVGWRVPPAIWIRSLYGVPMGTVMTWGMVDRAGNGNGSFGDGFTGDGPGHLGQGEDVTDHYAHVEWESAFGDDVAVMS